MALKRFQTVRLAASLAATAFAAAACGSSNATTASAGDQVGAPLELSLGESGAMASCIRFDSTILADMSSAFAGTVTSLEGETVTLSIDHWFTDGDAATAILEAPSGMEALIGGIDFKKDQEYLITSANGTVNYCGYSGPATPDLTKAFEEAFGS